MARLDIKSFEKGIEKIDEQIRKLEERKANFETRFTIQLNVQRVIDIGMLFIW